MATRKPAAKKAAPKKRSAAVKKVVKVAGVKAGVVKKKARLTATEKAKNKKAYRKTATKTKAAAKTARARATPKQKMEAAIQRIIRKATKAGEDPKKAVAAYKAELKAGKGAKAPAKKAAPAKSAKAKGPTLTAQKKEIRAKYKSLIDTARSGGKDAYAKATTADKRKAIHTKTMAKIATLRKKRDNALGVAIRKAKNKREGRPGTASSPEAIATRAKKVAWIRKNGMYNSKNLKKAPPKYTRNLSSKR